MYDAILVVSFGGPERNEDVLPFLENVTEGRNIPRERLLEVAKHYSVFGGKSPINDQCRELIAALRAELTESGLDLPVYWGNRNWHPMLADTLRQMKDDGVKHALAFMTSAYSSYSGCRQYRENIVTAQAEVGEGAPKVDKLRVFFNHPGFIEASAARVREAMSQFLPNELPETRFVFTAHSIPCSMAETCEYERQLRETAQLVAAAMGVSRWNVVYQSRSGPPSQPWLEPDVLDFLRQMDGRNVIIVPIGFISDHMEVIYDLDTEVAELARELGIKLVRAGTVGTHPAFIKMVQNLIVERILPNELRLAMGEFGPNHDVCPADCCPAPSRAGRPPVLATEGALQRP
ncbi:MAG TPA: ferrochelatase [Bryobacteraceae bacterium]|jgi:ferrochelatase|nr:ferrochelatase [Bryobacteraceae bacterium]